MTDTEPMDVDLEGTSSKTDKETPTPQTQTKKSGKRTGYELPWYVYLELHIISPTTVPIHSS